MALSRVRTRRDYGDNPSARQLQGSGIFLADGHIEVQVFGPASVVYEMSLDEISNEIIEEING